MHCAERALTTALLLLLAQPATAAGTLSISAGIDYSDGEYGGERGTETWVFPVIAKYENGPLTLKASLPYIRTRGPGDVVGIGPDRVPAAGSSEQIRSESGIGDLVLSAGYTVLQNRAVLVDLIGKVKVPTADEDRGLGTGETDYSIQSDLATVVSGVTVFGTLGWKKYGDPGALDYRDPMFASLGAGFRPVAPLFVGASYDWRDKVTRRGSQIRELMLFASHKLSPEWKLQSYLIRGFSDNSPDLGGGMILTRIY